MKIYFGHLSTKNLATLAQRVISISKALFHPVVKDHVLLTEVESAYNDFDAVYTKSTYSGKGPVVAEADARRDEPFEGVKLLLSGYAKISGCSFQQDAKDLYAIFESFGLDLDRYSYSEQTAQMVKLIEELDKPVNVSKIVRLNFTEPFEIMKSAQSAFEKVFGEQAKANAELRQMESATSLRKNLETALRNYLTIVTAMKDLDGWKELYTELNEVVKAAKNSKQSSAESLPPVPAN